VLASVLNLPVLGAFSGLLLVASLWLFSATAEKRYRERKLDLMRRRLRQRQSDVAARDAARK
jgi:hypothetical protein